MVGYRVVHNCADKRFIIEKYIIVGWKWKDALFITSICSEPFATKKILVDLLQSGINIRVFTTDRSSLMKKLFRYILTSQ
jgi:hypothetical protein